MTIHRLKENSLLTQFHFHRVVYFYPCHSYLYDALTCTWNILGFDIVTPVSCAATVETQFLFLEDLSSCFYCVNDFACVSPMLSLTKDTDRVSLFLIIPMVLSFRSYTSNVSGCIIYLMSSTTAEGCLSRPPYPTPPNFRRFAQYRASLAVFCWEWTSRTPEACRLRPSSATHRNFCSRSRKIPGSSSNWILWWQGHYFFYVCFHNKFALAILGFQSFPGYLLANFIRLQVCDLCSYVWIDHFQQIAEFLRCADRFVVDLCDKHLLESNSLAGRSFERCYYKFGQFCCGSTGFFLQFQAFMRRL